MPRLKMPVPYVPDQRREMPGLWLAALWTLQSYDATVWWPNAKVEIQLALHRQIPEDVFLDILAHQRQNTWSRGVQHTKSMWCALGVVERGAPGMCRLTPAGWQRCQEMAAKAISQVMLQDMFLHLGQTMRTVYNRNSRFA